MTATPKAVPPGRQMRQNVSRLRSSQPKSSAAHKTPAADAKPEPDSKEAPPCPVLTASKTTSPEKKPRQNLSGRKHKKGAPLTEEKLSSQPATTKVTHDAAASVTPVTEPISPKFYAFGWDAHPTRASLNAVCQDFLYGQCRFNERCSRIHPRTQGFFGFSTSTSNGSTSNIAVAMANKVVQSSSFISNTQQSRGVTNYNTTGTAQPDPHAGQEIYSISQLAKSGVQLRYHTERGIVPCRLDADTDGGQTSDDSQDTVLRFLSSNDITLMFAYDQINFSPQGSSCSSTSEDSTITTNRPKTHPPPPSRYFCRRWLQKVCQKTYDCPYVHGNLEYDIPVDGIYPPPPRLDIICKWWQNGVCTRGYLCSHRHGDLAYGQSTQQVKNAGNARAWDAEDNLNADGNVSGGSDDAHIAYPPPKFNAFCKDWMMNRCNLGPNCQFYHDDVNYEPPVRGIHPPPRYPIVCGLSKLNDCFLGYACDFIHEDLQYDTPTPRHPLNQQSPPLEVEARPPPKFSEVCQQWILGRCTLGYSCEYRHLDLKYDNPVSAPPMPQTQPEPVNESVSDPPVGQRPAPKNQDVCIQWLRGRCKARYGCKYRHEDLDYDPPSSKSIAVPPSSRMSDVNETMEGRSWTIKVHDHARVKLGPGFDIQELQTGFETPWIYLGNIPAHIKEKEIADLLQPFGKVVDLKLPTHISNPTILARARFETPESARDASTVLHNAQAFGVKITARLPMHNASLSDAMFNDASVRIRWEAPSRTAYCGYSNMKLAEAGMQVAREKAFRDNHIRASVHVGLPVVGVVTVRFCGLPVDVTKEDMAWFAKPDDVVWARPNYKDLDLARIGIQRILQQNSELLDFMVQPPPYKNARIQAWAHFATPSDAKAACNRLHGRKPMFTGKTRIVAEHLQSLSLAVSATAYKKLGSDIRALRRLVYNDHRTTMSIIERPAPMKTLIKLSGDDLRELGQLKAELSKILNWETIRQGQAIAWDPFFAHPAGQSFLGDIEHCTPNVTIHVDIPRRMIRLLGPSAYRAAVRQQILDKLTILQTQQTRTIPLDGWLLGHFMQTNLAQLQKKFGCENINLDFCRRRLIVRGGDDVYQEARDLVQRVRQKQLHPARRRNAAICPVCFDEVTNPIILPCAHSWCRDCLTHYLSSSIDNKYFPLTCLGNNAKCTEHIPLHTARKVLTVPEFDAVVEAAFSAYIQARGDEFHYCPTPDCPQIYRRSPRDTVLQCPSCLLRICPSCHVEAHDGFTCPDPEGDKNLFQAWMAHHDVKACPGCHVLIERDEGCNHMTCTQCKTHICWVCLKTFPGGNGIYGHMRSVHGGIGLAD